jgi:endonuclease/exonuclease/phosphatase (EEP) superfamily protein YafD
MYLPPVIPASPADLTNLISQLSPPFILLGDFNAKKIPWGAVLTDEREDQFMMYVLGSI